MRTTLNRAARKATQRPNHDTHPLPVLGLGSFFLFFIVTSLLVLSLAMNAEASSGLTISFVDPTPPDGTKITNLRAQPTATIKVEISTDTLEDVTYRWQDDDYLLYGPSLTLLYNFDNNSALGETDTYIIDMTGNGNDATWGNSTTTINYITGKYGLGIQFDGEADYLKLPTDIISYDNIRENGVTYAAWVKTESASGRKAILGQSTRDIYYYFTSGGIELNGSKPAMYAFDAADSTYYSVESSTTITDGKWHYIVGTYDPSDARLRLYLDGELDKVGDHAFEEFGFPGTLEANYIGRRGTINYFQGAIDEVSIWNIALGQDAIRQLYNSNVTRDSADVWSVEISQSLTLGTGTYSVTASSADDSATTARSIICVSTTTELYDNRHAAVVVTADDFQPSTIAEFEEACEHARNNKVAISPAVITSRLDSTAWQFLQQEINKGFVFPVSHSSTHAYPCIRPNCTWPDNWTPNPDYDVIYEVANSKEHITNNLTLPRYAKYSGVQHLIAWVEPGAYSAPFILETLADQNFLISRSAGVMGTGTAYFSDWNADTGLFERDAAWPGDDRSIGDLNEAFDDVYSNGGVYHLFFHPTSKDWTAQGKFPQHFTYIGNKTDIWYVGYDYLYMYRYAEDTIKPEITIDTYSADLIEATISFPGEDRARYGLLYPLTYGFSVPDAWTGVYVFGGTSDDDYDQMEEKTREEYWNGIDAYRIDANNNTVYVSRAFPEYGNEFSLTILPVPVG